MFRVKTRRHGKHSAEPKDKNKEHPPSPPPTLPPSPPLNPAPQTVAPVVSADISGAETGLLGGVAAAAAAAAAPGHFMTRMTNFFEAESVAASTTRPWLRLERGLRLQKLRAYAEAYPDLTADEKDALYKTLAKANDAKLLNTKQQIVYENGKILSIRGLKPVKGTDGITVFKIEVHRQTKKKGSE
jgi:hypothetical protein